MRRWAVAQFLLQQMKKLSPFARLITATAALSLIAALFLPIWRIELWAPQYPEGLVMQIWLSKLTGDVAIINGLNHYIGMAHIDEKMFPELQILTGIALAYTALGLVVAAIGRRIGLIAYIGMLAAGGVAAMVDFYRWGYQYGHNLDPNAAIKVPGMAYQPPLIGYKQLLNFGAYSVPDAGGWVFIVAALAVIGVWVYEIKKKK